MVALHLYSMVWDLSKESKVRVFVTIPSPLCTVCPTMISSSVTIRFPIPSYQLIMGVFWRWSDLFAEHVSVNLSPSCRVAGKDVMSTESASSGPTTSTQECVYVQTLCQRILLMVEKYYSCSRTLYITAPDLRINFAHVVF